jgi:hypothetical protein
MSGRRPAAAAAFCLAILLPATALAQTAGEPSLEDRFGRLDAKRDSAVSWEETRPQREGEHRRLDRNGAGGLVATRKDAQAVFYRLADPKAARVLALQRAA